LWQRFLPSCWTIAGGGRFETAPVAILVEPPPDPQFDEKPKTSVTAILSAIERVQQGERTVSIDEMTGIKL